MNWKDYIISDKEILPGKPTLKGTRLLFIFGEPRLRITLNSHPGHAVGRHLKRPGYFK